MPMNVNMRRRRLRLCARWRKKLMERKPHKRNEEKRKMETSEIWNGEQQKQYFWTRMHLSVASFSFHRFVDGRWKTSCCKFAFAFRAFNGLKSRDTNALARVHHGPWARLGWMKILLCQSNGRTIVPTDLHAFPAHCGAALKNHQPNWIIPISTWPYNCATPS